MAQLRVALERLRAPPRAPPGSAPGRGRARTAAQPPVPSGPRSGPGLASVKSTSKRTARRVTPLRLQGGDDCRQAEAPRALEALRHRDFRLLFTGQTVSLIGDAAFVTALGWKTFTLRAAKLGVVLVCQALGVLTTLLIGGALADRLSRRQLMIVSDLAGCRRRRARRRRRERPPHVPAARRFATLVGLGDGFFYPAFGGMVPLVVEQPSDRLGQLADRRRPLEQHPASARRSPALLYHPAGSATVFAVDAGVVRSSPRCFVYRTRPRVIEATEPRGHVPRDRRRSALRRRGSRGSG